MGQSETSYSLTDSYLHSLWHCPPIHSFCHQVIATMSQILAHSVPCSLTLGIVGDMDSLDLPPHQCKLLWTSLVQAKKVHTTKLEKTKITPACDNRAISSQFTFIFNKTQCQHQPFTNSGIRESLIWNSQPVYPTSPDATSKALTPSLLLSQGYQWSWKVISMVERSKIPPNVLSHLITNRKRLTAVIFIRSSRI